MSLETITERVRATLGVNSGLGYAVRIELEDGVIHIDGASIPNQVTNEDLPGESTLRCSEEVLGRLMDGTLGATMAYMTGKLKVSGSMGVALKLASLLED